MRANVRRTSAVRKTFDVIFCHLIREVVDLIFDLVRFGKRQEIFGNVRFHDLLEEVVNHSLQIADLFDGSVGEAFVCISQFFGIFYDVF